MQVTQVFQRAVRIKNLMPPLAKKMGVTLETIKPGNEAIFPMTGQTVKVHCTGTLTDGTKFYTTRDRGKPFTFKLGKGEVIKGWDEGVKRMSLGQHAKLTCTPAFAYGKNGLPGLIPPNATLIFDIELLGIK